MHLWAEQKVALKAEPMAALMVVLTVVPLV